MRRPAALTLIISLAICAAPCAARCFAAEPDKPASNGGSVYEYDERAMPEVFFFPPEKARWDGTKVTIREWYMLTDYQKEKFISEYIDEIRKAYRSPIDVIGMDYLRALNMFSYFSNDKRSAEPTTKVIDTLLAGQGKVDRVTPAPVRESLSGDTATVTIVAGVGDDITITLESNPTTGYSWRPREAYRRDILKPVRNDYVPDETGLTGSGGREVWTFTAVGEGSTAVTFQYARPWEQDEKPAREARFVIGILPSRATEAQPR